MKKTYCWSPELEPDWRLQLTLEGSVFGVQRAELNNKLIKELSTPSRSYPDSFLNFEALVNQIFGVIATADLLWNKVICE